jgi:hypothetical protein
MVLQRKLASLRLEPRPKFVHLRIPHLVFAAFPQQLSIQQHHITDDIPTAEYHV